MIYTQYITKKRMKAQGICENVNIPWGTILPVTDGFIIFNEKHLCAVKSQNAKEYFWGYATINPDAEIERQKAVATLLKSAPHDSGDALADSSNPWNRYGRLEQIMGSWIWQWNESVDDLSKDTVNYLQTCIRNRACPKEVCRWTI